jgi:hypothetical protein
LSASAGESASQWSKWIAQRVLDNPLGLDGASLSLVWPTNSGSRMNTDSMPIAEIITSSVVIAAARLLPVSSA